AIIARNEMRAVVGAEGPSAYAPSANADLSFRLERERGTSADASPADVRARRCKRNSSWLRSPERQRRRLEGLDGRGCLRVAAGRADEPAGHAARFRDGDARR